MLNEKPEMCVDGFGAGDYLISGLSKKVDLKKNLNFKQKLSQLFQTSAI